jgi:endoribonuclease Dicer
MNSDMEMGLLTSKVSCLIDCLLEYNGVTEMRCIVFVERVIVARVLEILLNTLLPKYNSWKVRYITGKHNEWKTQSPKIQDEIVEEFRKGLVCFFLRYNIHCFCNFIKQILLLIREMFYFVGKCHCCDSGS